MTHKHKQKATYVLRFLSLSLSSVLFSRVGFVWKTVNMPAFNLTHPPSALNPVPLFFMSSVLIDCIISSCPFCFVSVHTPPMCFCVCVCVKGKGEVEGRGVHSLHTHTCQCDDDDAFFCEFTFHEAMSIPSWYLIAKLP